MVLNDNGVYLVHGTQFAEDPDRASELAGVPVSEQAARKGTISYRILHAHNRSGNDRNLQLIFDSLTSHDITYVGIIQTARASGMERFPVPYVLTNCHNSLCAVGGTINEDDHRFALSAAHKYGGIYVPTNMAVLHSYNREVMAGCGKMILGSDSHTRYGALGTLAVGEGGGELAKQLLGRTYDIPMPETVCVYLEGSVKPGVGPHDVALALCAAVYSSGFAKNRILEFTGPGIRTLSMEYRNGIDVMTTETTCLSSVWATDAKTEEYLALHGRPGDYKELQPAEVAYYDRWIRMDLATIEPMIALPMHPSNAIPIRELLAAPKEILRECEQRVNASVKGASISLTGKVRDGAVWVEQAVIAGCSGGTFESICAAADILRNRNIGNGIFRMSIYPGSMPCYMQLLRNGITAELVSSGAVMRECFCGPCFGAGDTPANGELSIRHTTRNFPNREGSKPGEGQLSVVALMDARSIAATAANGGRLTPATDLDVTYRDYPYEYDSSLYQKRVYWGYGKPEPEQELRFGPNIRDWPEMPAMRENLLLNVCSSIDDPVTTTDELIPSGETASFRSNPERLSEFTLSRRDPEYVQRAKTVRTLEKENASGDLVTEELKRVYHAVQNRYGAEPENTGVASAVFARKPGDGSAREQAASCQRVLGGAANLAWEYATKRYRSNCVNWGIVPFRTDSGISLACDEWIFVPGIRSGILNGQKTYAAVRILPDGKTEPLSLYLDDLTEAEKQILTDGCLINYYRNSSRKTSEGENE